jgi:2-dehydro-3-deoxy-D-gluconate 5-dehydrogenase
MTILDQFRLDGKTALVTGCRRGIGRGYAQALAEAGADIIGVSVSLEPSGSNVEQDVLAAGRRFWSHACDFSDRAALYAFIARVKEEAPPVDILVNNAGTNIRMPAVEYQDEPWDEVIEVNLNAQFILAREFGKEMVARGAGKIIFTASLMTFQGGITIPAYAASKGGIGQLTKALANEWAAHGVNVNAITPGYIATDLTEPLRTSATRGPEILARIPAGRWGTTDDMKGAVLFLASNAAAYVHGTVLVVDGGWLAR